LVNRIIREAGDTKQAQEGGKEAGASKQHQSLERVQEKGDRSAKSGKNDKFGQTGEGNWVK